MVEKLWRYVKPFSYNTSVSRTDRRTDGRTDRITISISRVNSIMLTRDNESFIHIAEWILLLSQKLLSVQRLHGLLMGRSHDRHYVDIMLRLCRQVRRIIHWRHIAWHRVECSSSENDASSKRIDIFISRPKTPFAIQALRSPSIKFCANSERPFYGLLTAQWFSFYFFH